VIFERILKALFIRRIRYLLIGGAAVNFHGFSRATGDLDIMLSFGKTNVVKFVQMAKSLGFLPRVPVAMEGLADARERKSWIRKKGMKVFSIFDPKTPEDHIDIMVEDYLDFEEAYRRRKVMKIKGMDVSVASIPDIVRLKKIAGRERDLIDIGALNQIKKMIHAEKTKKKRP